MFPYKNKDSTTNNNSNSNLSSNAFNGLTYSDTYDFLTDMASITSAMTTTTPSLTSTTSISATVTTTNEASKGNEAELDWHASVTDDLRNHLVKHLVQAIFPQASSNEILKDGRIRDLVDYARKVEGDNFDKAKNKMEYYSLLAQKIYQVQKRLESQKHQRHQQQQQLLQQQQQQQQIHHQLQLPFQQFKHLQHNFSQHHLQQQHRHQFYNHQKLLLQQQHHHQQQQPANYLSSSTVLPVFVDNNNNNINSNNTTITSGSIKGGNVNNNSNSNNNMRAAPDSSINFQISVSSSSVIPTSISFSGEISFQNYSQAGVLSSLSASLSSSTSSSSSSLTTTAAAPAAATTTTTLLSSISLPDNCSSASFEVFNYKEETKRPDANNGSSTSSTNTISSSNSSCNNITTNNHNTAGNNILNKLNAPTNFDMMMSPSLPCEDALDNLYDLPVSEGGPGVQSVSSFGSPFGDCFSQFMAPPSNKSTTFTSIITSIENDVEMFNRSSKLNNNCNDDDNDIDLLIRTSSLLSASSAATKAASSFAVAKTSISVSSSSSLTCTSLMSELLMTDNDDNANDDILDNFSNAHSSMTKRCHQDGDDDSKDLDVDDDYSVKKVKLGSHSSVAWIKSEPNKDEEDAKMATLTDLLKNDDDNDDDGDIGVDKKKISLLFEHSDDNYNYDDIKIKKEEITFDNDNDDDNINKDNANISDINNNNNDKNGHNTDDDITGQESKQIDNSQEDSGTRMNDDTADNNDRSDDGGNIFKEQQQHTCLSNQPYSEADLYAAILPSFQKIYKQEPESLPFRMPVNPDLLGIPDYFDKIKNPMDLSTIEMKLNNRQYTDPWQYINDVYLMFENAWCYNKRTHRVYKYCTKLSEIFDSEIDGPVRSLGYCCGRRYVFYPQALCCYGKECCLIQKDAVFYDYLNKYAYCEKCFNDLPSPVIDIDEPTQPGLKVNKSEFTRERNDKLEGEAFVTCTVCDRKMHQICVSHFEPVTTKMFVCKNCQASTGMGADFGIGDRKKTNKFTAKKLPNTKLGTYLENRVNQFLKKKDSASVEVSIRVLSSFDKFAEIKQGMKDRFSDCLVDPPQYPYRVKAIFAFAEIDSVDVCFFGMHVQEYGSECPDPNSRRVYIAYLDSVNFFQPRQYRTSVYHEILLGYLEYAKSLGFLTAHIWACPPSEGDDYIFHCHPPEQKIPKPKRLQEWYRKMLDKAVEERVIVEYKDIIQDAQDGQMQCLAGFPYFEGDYLPMTIEEVIKNDYSSNSSSYNNNNMCYYNNSLGSVGNDDGCGEADDGTCDDPAVNNDDLKQPKNQLNETRKFLKCNDNNSSSSNVNNNNNHSHNNKKGKKKNVKNKKQSKSRSKSAFSQLAADDLFNKVMASVEKNKEVFFVIHLQQNVYKYYTHNDNCHGHHLSSPSSPFNSSLTPPISSLPPIMDPDPVSNIDLMDGRDAFLTLCREKHLEFSSLRRAKFSTMVMLYELHVQMRDDGLVCSVCCECKATVETYYHCPVCEDYDQCIQCHMKFKHVHHNEMKKVGLGLDDSATAAATSATQQQQNSASSSTSAQQQQQNDASNINKLRQTWLQKYEQALVHAASCRDGNCRIKSCILMKQFIQHLQDIIKLKNKPTHKNNNHSKNCGTCSQMARLCLYHAKMCKERNKCPVPSCNNVRKKLELRRKNERIKHEQLTRRRIMNMREVDDDVDAAGGSNKNDCFNDNANDDKFISNKNNDNNNTNNDDENICSYGLDSNVDVQQQQQSQHIHSSNNESNKSINYVDVNNMASESHIINQYNNNNNNSSSSSSNNNINNANTFSPRTMTNMNKSIIIPYKGIKIDPSINNNNCNQNSNGTAMHFNNFNNNTNGNNFSTNNFNLNANNTTGGEMVVDNGEARIGGRGNSSRSFSGCSSSSGGKLFNCMSPSMNASSSPAMKMDTKQTQHLQHQRVVLSSNQIITSHSLNGSPHIPVSLTGPHLRHSFSDQGMCKFIDGSSGGELLQQQQLMKSSPQLKDVIPAVEQMLPDTLQQQQQQNLCKLIFSQPNDTAAVCSQNVDNQPSTSGSKIFDGTINLRGNQTNPYAVQQILNFFRNAKRNPEASRVLKSNPSFVWNLIKFLKEKSVPNRLLSAVATSLTTSSTTTATATSTTSTLAVNEATFTAATTSNLLQTTSSLVSSDQKIFGSSSLNADKMLSGHTAYSAAASDDQQLQQLHQQQQRLQQQQQQQQLLHRQQQFVALRDQKQAQQHQFDNVASIDNSMNNDIINNNSSSNNNNSFVDDLLSGIESNSCTPMLPAKFQHPQHVNSPGQPGNPLPQKHQTFFQQSSLTPQQQHQQQPQSQHFHQQHQLPQQHFLQQQHQQARPLSQQPAPRYSAPDFPSTLPANKLLKNNKNNMATPSNNNNNLLIHPQQLQQQNFIPGSLEMISPPLQRQPQQHLAPPHQQQVSFQQQHQFYPQQQQQQHFVAMHAQQQHLMLQQQHQHSVQLQQQQQQQPHQMLTQQQQYHLQQQQQNFSNRLPNNNSIHYQDRFQQQQHFPQQHSQQHQHMSMSSDDLVDPYLNNNNIMKTAANQIILSDGHHPIKSQHSSMMMVGGGALVDGPPVAANYPQQKLLPTKPFQQQQQQQMMQTQQRQMMPMYTDPSLQQQQQQSSYHHHHQQQQQQQQYHQQKHLLRQQQQHLQHQQNFNCDVLAFAEPVNDMLLQQQQNHLHPQ